jgi:hypothetical protein
LVLGDDAWLGFYRGFQASLMLQGVDLLRDRVVRAKKEKEKEKQLNTRWGFAKTGSGLPLSKTISRFCFRPRFVRTFFWVFPMFVPSLSWQNVRFYIEMAQKRRFSQVGDWRQQVVDGAVEALGARKTILFWAIYIFKS